MSDVLDFMQKEDRNGSWGEWKEEIKKGESQFDSKYVKEVLNDWHTDSGDQKYKDQMNKL